MKEKSFAIITELQLIEEEKKENTIRHNKLPPENLEISDLENNKEIFIVRSRLNHDEFDKVTQKLNGEKALSGKVIENLFNDTSNIKRIEKKYSFDCHFFEFMISRKEKDIPFIINHIIDKDFSFVIKYINFEKTSENTWNPDGSGQFNMARNSFLRIALKKDKDKIAKKIDDLFREFFSLPFYNLFEGHDYQRLREKATALMKTPAKTIFDMAIETGNIWVMPLADSDLKPEDFFNGFNKYFSNGGKIDNENIIELVKYLLEKNKHLKDKAYEEQFKILINFCNKCGSERCDTSSLIKLFEPQSELLNQEEEPDSQSHVASHQNGIHEGIPDPITLWREANKLLSQSDWGGFLKAADRLFKFLKENDLNETSLRDDLASDDIPLEGQDHLKQLAKVSSDYAHHTVTNEDPQRESMLVERVPLIACCFLNCKSEIPSMKEPVGTFNEIPVLIDIMNFIKNTENKYSAIAGHRTKTLMAHKISEARRLEKNGVDSDTLLKMVMSDKGDNLPQYLAYQYAVKNTEKGRDHGSYTVTGQQFSRLSEEHRQLSGDALKTQILASFKDQLAEITDEGDLHDWVKTIKTTDEYGVLATGQGLPTRILGIFGLKTSSVVAFEKMIEATEQEINLQKGSRLQM